MHAIYSTLISYKRGEQSMMKVMSILRWVQRRYQNHWSVIRCVIALVKLKRFGLRVTPLSAISSRFKPKWLFRHLKNGWAEKIWPMMKLSLIWISISRTLSRSCYLEGFKVLEKRQKKRKERKGTTLREITFIIRKTCVPFKKSRLYSANLVEIFLFIAFTFD